MEHVIGEAWISSVLAHRNPVATPLPDGHSWQLIYSRGYRRTMPGFVLFSGFTIVVGFLAFHQKPQALLLAEMFFGAITISAIHGMLDALWVHLIVSDAGIYFKYPGRASVTIAWKQVRRVTYSHLYRRFEIRGEASQRICISQARDGLGTLRAYLEQYVPSHLWDTASGYLLVVEPSDRPQFSVLVNIAGGE